jgi:hypothetical protein
LAYNGCGAGDLKGSTANIKIADSEKDPSKQISTNSNPHSSNGGGSGAPATKPAAAPVAPVVKSSTNTPDVASAIYDYYHAPNSSSPYSVGFNVSGYYGPSLVGPGGGFGFQLSPNGVGFTTSLGIGMTGIGATAYVTDAPLSSGTSLSLQITAVLSSTLSSGPYGDYELSFPLGGANATINRTEYVDFALINFMSALWK